MSKQFGETDPKIQMFYDDLREKQIQAINKNVRKKLFLKQHMKMIEEYELNQIKTHPQDNHNCDKTEEVNELWNDLITYQQDPAMERQMSKLSKEMKEFFEDVNIDVK